MRYRVLACDYDGTLAHHGKVDDATVAALARFVESGRKLVLVTGRLLDDLLSIFPDVHLFERIVVENGAVSYDPATRKSLRLAEPPPDAFLAALRERGVTPLGAGEVIVSTWEPMETTVLETIRELGMGHQVIFNKGAVMVLPSGIDKGTGLEAVLQELCLSGHNVVGVGDAENDHAFLQRCELAVAVQNALPLLKQRADLVTKAERGEGVTELIQEILASDLARLAPALTRHDLVLGTGEDGREFRIPAYGACVLIAGPSGSGKSQTTTAILERISGQHYQACLVDPEGDYGELEHAISVGEAERPPSIDEVLQLLKRPDTQVIVNLLGVSFADRPGFFATLLQRLQALRAQTGRPHWVLLDEAHHLLPSTWVPGQLTLPESLGSMVAVTVHVGEVSAAVLRMIQLVIAVGPKPEETLAAYAQAVGRPVPSWRAGESKEGDVVVWSPASSDPPLRVSATPAAWVHRRHRRKYAKGELGPDRSFYFRGPTGKLNLRAQNLALFVQISEGVDDSTWLFHLRRGDYSHWFREHIKDESLAMRAEEIERDPQATAESSRGLIRHAIEEHYTLPA